MRWRPTVDVCRHDDLVIRRFELLHGKEQALVDTVTADIRAVSPETEVRTHPVHFGDPWDFGEVYGVLHDFASSYRFEPDREDYLVHVTTGTHVAQICLFLLTETRYLPARLLQTRPAETGTGEPPGVLLHHRSRPLEVRPARGAVRAGAIGGSLTPQGRHRDQEPSLQRSGHPDRARGERVAGAGAAHRADRRGQDAARPAHLRAEEVAAARHRRVRPGELRDGAWRRGDVGAVRPRPRRVHRRRSRARRPAPDR